jgi:hypothetical protein
MFDTKLRKSAVSRPHRRNSSQSTCTCRAFSLPAGTPKKRPAVSNAWQTTSQTAGKPTILSPRTTGAAVVSSKRNEFREAVRLKPSAWSPWLDYARLAQNEPSERNQVLAALREAVRLNPKNLEAQLLLGHHLVTMDHPKQALEILDGFETCRPENPPACSSRWRGPTQK